MDKQIAAIKLHVKAHISAPQTQKSIQYLVAPLLTNHTTISMMVGWMWKVTPQVATLSPHALTKRTQAVAYSLTTILSPSEW